MIGVVFGFSSNVSHPFEDKIFCIYDVFSQPKYYKDFKCIIYWVGSSIVGET